MDEASLIQTVKEQTLRRVRDDALRASGRLALLLQDIALRLFEPDFRVGDWRHRLGVSASTAAECFRELAPGLTPTAYIRDARLDVAESLLRATDLPVFRVAVEVGYGSEASFRRAFNRRYGVTPLQFRAGEAGRGHYRPAGGPAPFGLPMEPVEGAGGSALDSDPTLAARLLLGVLSGHEQRMLATFVAERDAELSAQLRRHLPSFEMFGAEAALEYEAVLCVGRDVEAQRKAILGRTAALAARTEDLLALFTAPTNLAASELPRPALSWYAAEQFLALASKSGHSEDLATTYLELAELVIDVVEMLGCVGHSPRVPAVVADFRRRLEEASVALTAGPAKMPAQG